MTVKVLASGARTAQRVADETQSFGPTRAQRQLEHLGPDVHEVADDLGEKRRVRQRESRDSDFPVMQRRHRVEEMRGADRAGHRSRSRFGTRGAAVSERYAHPRPREFAHEIQRARKFRGESHRAHAATIPARGPEECTQTRHRWLVQVVRRKSARRESVHERTFEVRTDHARTLTRTQRTHATL